MDPGGPFFYFTCEAWKKGQNTVMWVTEASHSWSSAPVLKTGMPKGIVSSNLTASARSKIALMGIFCWAEASKWTASFACEMRKTFPCRRRKSTSFSRMTYWVMQYRRISPPPQNRDSTRYLVCNCFWGVKIDPSETFELCIYKQKERQLSLFLFYTNVNGHYVNSVKLLLLLKWKQL